MLLIMILMILTSNDFDVCDHNFIDYILIQL